MKNVGITFDYSTAKCLGSQLSHYTGEPTITNILTSQLPGRTGSYISLWQTSRYAGRSLADLRNVFARRKREFLATHGFTGVPF